MIISEKKSEDKKLKKEKKKLIKNNLANKYKVPSSRVSWNIQIDNPFGLSFTYYYNLKNGCYTDWKTDFGAAGGLSNIFNVGIVRKIQYGSTTSFFIGAGSLFKKSENGNSTKFNINSGFIFSEEYSYAFLSSQRTGNFSFLIGIDSAVPSLFSFGIGVGFDLY